MPFVAKPRVVPRAARRPRGKARRGSILGIFDRGATQSTRDALPLECSGAFATGCLAILALLAVDPTAVGAQDEENELDRFMEQVLEQRERNAAVRLQYVLDEQSQFRLSGPGDVALWGFRGDYTWYERDGFFVRSPVRINGVTIDEARRREYETRWLQREQRRRERRRDERRSPARMSARSTRDNVELAIERLWDARIDDEELVDSITERARTWGDDAAAIAAASDRILEAAGGVSAVGFERAVARARDGFSMLESGRLLPDEVTGMLDRAIGQIAPAAPAATEDAFARFLELFDLAVRFELPLAPTNTAPAETHADPEVARLRATALAARRAALSALAGAAAEGQGMQETPPADPVWANMEPRFVSDAYFLDFEFEPGNYYLVGRETLDGHDVLRIEYYPERMFTEIDEDENETPDRGGDGRDEAAAMDKTSLVTLWIDPARHQIVRYTFDNLGFDFLPGRWLFRLDDLTASMTMRQPFPGVWLPARIDMRATLSLATGTYEATATRTYADYREAETGGRVRTVGADRSR